MVECLRLPLRAVSGGVRPLGSGARERERPHLYPAQPTEALWYRGLIGRAFRDEGSGPQEFFFVPNELIQLLPSRSQVRRHRTYISSVYQPNNGVALASASLVDDACTTLAYLRLFPASPGRPEQLLATEYTSELRTHLLQPDALGILLHLLQELGLVTGYPMCVNSGKARRFLQATRGEQQSSLVNAWHHSVEWCDVIHVPGLRFDEPSSLRTDAPKTRQAILEQLAHLTPRHWIDLSSFVNHVREYVPDFQRMAGDYDSWYVFDSKTGEHLRGFHNWDRVDGALVEFMIFGPLHWLGITDTALDPCCFRLTSVFDAMCGGGSWDVNEDAHPITIRADGILQAKKSTNRADRFLAARIGEWHLSSDDTYQYQITAHSLRLAADSGVETGQIIAFLQRVSNGLVPPQLEQAVLRLHNKGVEVKLSDILVLRVQSETLMDQLRKHPKTSRLLGDVLGPMAVEVRSRDWNDLRRAMLAMGIFVEMEE